MDELRGDQGEERLSGGAQTLGVVRVGDTVRYPACPRSDFVEALLRHLESVGFAGAPRALGYDAHSRQVLTFALTACTARTQTPPSTPISESPPATAGCGHSPPTRPGTDYRNSLPIAPRLANGTDRRTAVLHVPAGYRATTPAPMLLQFHGAGPNATAAGYEHSSPLHALSDLDGVPRRVSAGATRTEREPGMECLRPSPGADREIPFVNSLLDAVERDFCVNPRRVYAGGISNGANIVNYLACRDTARITAIAPVVGRMFGQDDGPCRPSRPVQILDLHSLNDAAVPYSGYPGPPANEFPLPAVPAWLDSWARLNGCAAASPAHSLPGNTVERDWPTCRARARITAHATHAGHSWPAQLDGEPAAQRVWTFLDTFTLPTPQ